VILLQRFGESRLGFPSNTLKHTATHLQHNCSTLQHNTTYCNTNLDKTSTMWRISSWHPLQHVETHCNRLQHTTTLCNILQHTATQTLTRLQKSGESRLGAHSNTLKYTATHLQHTCNILATHSATHCNRHLDKTSTMRRISSLRPLQHIETNCNTLATQLQHTATRCNNLQH